MEYHHRKFTCSGPAMFLFKELETKQGGMRSPSFSSFHSSHLASTCLQDGEETFGREFTGANE